MPVSWIVLIVAAALAAGAALWVLRAYRGANDGARPAPALIACATAGLGALALYLFIGRPDLPDAPYAQRIQTLHHRDPRSYTLDEALAVLHDIAKAQPTDAAPHVLIGQLLLERGQAEPAAQSFNAALRRDPHSQDATLGLAEAMVASNDGRVSPDALQMFQTVAQTSQSPLPFLYEAKAALQAGQDAHPFWTQALMHAPPDSPLRPEHPNEDWRVSLGRALVQIDGGITQDSLRLFQLAGAQTRDPIPWVYQATAAMQAGEDARPLWAQALARMAPNDPARAMAQRMSTMSPQALQQQSAQP